MMDLEYEFEQALSGLWAPERTAATSGVSPVFKAPVTYGRVMKPNIEVAAQHALVRMSKSANPAHQKAAQGIVVAIEKGKLGGVWREDQQVPAKRAREKGGNWWEIIPTGRDAVAQRDSYNLEPLLLVYRQAIGNDAARMDRALVAGWQSWWCYVKCQLAFDACKNGCLPWDGKCISECTKTFAACVKAC